MPIHKTSLYDASLILAASGTLDLRGPSAAHGITVDGVHSAGTKSVTVADVAGTGLSAGDKVISGLTGRAVGTVASSATNTVTFVNGIKHTLVDDDTLELAPKFEIVGIMPLGSASTSNVNESDTEIDILIPCSTAYFGTLAPNGGTWTSFDDHITRFGAEGEIGDILATGLELPSGTLFEGRWKKISLSSKGSAIVYLKAATSQTF
tara:strand:+ start:2628 stop:3248 length:621 start_codon:yes stop_codon:yes gene_type:complete